MSPSLVAPPRHGLEKHIIRSDTNSPSWHAQPRKRLWIIGASLLLTIFAIGLGVGLGVGLTQGQGDDSGPTDDGQSAPPPQSGNGTNATLGAFWRPAAGQSWQILLEHALNDTTPNVPIYDIDLFENPTSTIEELHGLDRKVICYFSAGSYEDFRPDSDEFTSNDYAKALDGWPGEYWLDTNSTNVRSIMTKRLALAAEKGCDGIDPDNVDGYDNDTGFDLTTADAVDYLTFLAVGAHSLNMSIGLKNSGDIVKATIDFLQWAVNEQCVQYNECDLFRPFIEAGKPVFHIEYPDSAPSVSQATKDSSCDSDDSSTTGFSTVLKQMDLGNWVEYC